MQAVVERCSVIGAWGGVVVVATSTRAVDDPITQWAGSAGYAVYRGAADDVAGRILGAARVQAADWVARINADSPFVDPALLGEACRLARAGGCDFITNLAPRSFPYGVSVEMVRTAVLADFYQQFDDARHREHPTAMLYESLDALRYHNIHRDGPDLSQVRLTVDTPADLERLRSVVEILGPSWVRATYTQIVKRYEESGSR